MLFTMLRSPLVLISLTRKVLLPLETAVIPLVSNSALTDWVAP